MTNSDRTAHVTVFTKNECPRCDVVKSRFARAGLTGSPGLRVINVEEDLAPREEFSGRTPFEEVVNNYGREMPVVLVEDADGTRWRSGVHPDFIKEAVAALGG